MLDSLFEILSGPWAAMIIAAQDSQVSTAPILGMVVLFVLLKKLEANSMLKLFTFFILFIISLIVYYVKVPYLTMRTSTIGGMFLYGGEKLVYIVNFVLPLLCCAMILLERFAFKHVDSKESPMNIETVRSYIIESRKKEMGGGYRLRLIEDGKEMGGGVFPLAGYRTARETDEEAAQCAYDDALVNASAWISKKG